MKAAIKYGIAGIVALLALWFLVSSYRDAHRGYTNTDPGDNESYAHKVKRYPSGAEAALPPAITNAVVGLRTILSRHTDTLGDNFTKWSATATVEFINKHGGVERKTVDFTFGAMSGQPDWWPK
jgi:hypothetical protein